MTDKVHLWLSPALAWTIKTLVNQERFHVAMDLREEPDNEHDREYMKRLNGVSRLLKRRLLQVPNPNLKPSEESHGQHPQG
jgi:hypothetical protein